MFDLKKAIQCAALIKEYFKSKEEDANVEIPNNITLGSKEHLYYIFYSCLLDYGMRSKIYHRNLINTYLNYRDIFNPHYVTVTYQNNEENLLDIIKENIHPRYPNVAAKKWLNLSKFLNNNYPDNQLKEKISSFHSYHELYTFIANIRGYGQKTGGLLIRLIYDLGICDLNDELLNIPIDTHDIEISYLNGVIDKLKLNQTELKLLGDIWIEAGRKNGINASDIDKYLWSIGNKLCSKKECLKCPLKKSCKTKMIEVTNV